MRKFIVAACAVTLAAVWTVAPAMAQDTKAEDKTVKEKAVEAKDKIKDKAVEAKDKIKDKAVEAKDKIKDKVIDTKDKIKDKTADTKDKMDAKMERADVRAAQQALRDKGFDPGPLDGVHGPRTSAAVRNFQKAENMPMTGRLDDTTMAKLNVRMGSSDRIQPSATPATEPAPAKPTPAETPPGKPRS